jgi:hypothetical protein
MAHDEQQIALNTGVELLEWCKTESEAELIASGKAAYNWTARHLERGNTLVVEGSWRVDGVRHAVVCRVARGALPQHATVSVTAEP